MASQWEILFAAQVEQSDLPKPRQQYRFYLPRRWKFDFAWPEFCIAVEVEGGVFSQGRHVRGRGFVNDCIKYNTAAALGWRVFRYPSQLVEDGSAIEQIVGVVESAKATLDVLRAYGRAK